MTYTLTYDDEDRLLSSHVFGRRQSDSFTYNGLGLRVGKADQRGGRFTTCRAATTPGSPVLVRWIRGLHGGAGVKARGGVSHYYDYDRLGNLWTVELGDGQGAGWCSQDTTGFGAAT